MIQPNASSTSDGPRLVIVAGPPRGGSTMLQRMISAHPQVHTTSEPWLLLPLAYVGVDQDWPATYNGRTFRRAFNTFVETLPNGWDDYWLAAGNAARELYRKQMPDDASTWFLDKTPRYYLILDQIARMLPEAVVILLARHPLAVLDSVRRTWNYKTTLGMAKNRLDLVEWPARLADARDAGRAGWHYLQYETLVSQPEATMRQVCEWLSLSWNPAMIDLPTLDQPQFKLGLLTNGNSYPDRLGLGDEDRVVGEIADARRDLAEVHCRFLVLPGLRF